MIEITFYRLFIYVNVYVVKEETGIKKTRIKYGDRVTRILTLVPPISCFVPSYSVSILPAPVPGILIRLNVCLATL